MAKFTKDTPVEITEPVTDEEIDQALEERKRAMRKMQLGGFDRYKHKDLVIGIKKERVARHRLTVFAREKQEMEKVVRTSDWPELVDSAAKKLADLKTRKDTAYVLLAEGLKNQGRYDEAKKAIKKVENIDAFGKNLLGAIEKCIQGEKQDDGKICDCTGDTVDGVYYTNLHLRGLKYSQKHNNKVYHIDCMKCGFQNLTPLLPEQMVEMYTLRQEASSATTTLRQADKTAMRGRRNAGVQGQG